MPPPSFDPSTARSPSPDEVSALIDSVAQGKSGAEAALLEAVYRDLRAIAGALFDNQPAQHTLEPTALVHEAYLKLLTGREIAWESRAHFIAVAAKAMRQILVDHARAKRAQKRGGGADRVTLSGVALDDEKTEFDTLDLDDALRRLGAIDERQAKIVELRFFAGMKVPEIALVLGVSDRTVELDWRMARAWLRRDLKERDP